jgi:hypothetical protein
MTRLDSNRVTLFLLVLAVCAILAFPVPTNAADQVPFKGDFALLSLPAQSNAGCQQNTVRFNVSGSGPATHLGMTTVTEFVCLNPSDLTFTAFFTMIAANGDQVFATATGSGVPTSNVSFSLHSQWVINGGTGRFLGATGTGTATGEVNLVTGASPHQLVGTISSVGSD